jgi:hypothetical protein
MKNSLKKTTTKNDDDNDLDDFEISNESDEQDEAYVALKNFDANKLDKFNSNEHEYRSQ